MPYEQRLDPGGGHLFAEVRIVGLLNVLVEEERTRLAKTIQKIPVRLEKRGGAICQHAFHQGRRNTAGDEGRVHLALAQGGHCPFDRQMASVDLSESQAGSSEKLSRIGLCAAASGPHRNPLAAQILEPVDVERPVNEDMDRLGVKGRNDPQTAQGPGETASAAISIGSNVALSEGKIGPTFRQPSEVLLGTFRRKDPDLHACLVSNGGNALRERKVDPLGTAGSEGVDPGRGRRCECRKVANQGEREQKNRRAYPSGKHRNPSPSHWYPPQPRYCS